MSISLPDARQLPDEVLQALRLRALRGRELGFTEADLANVLGVARETICRWWAAYPAGGADALPQDRTGRPVGSGRTLSDDQSRRLQAQIDAHTPEGLGIASPLWTRRAVQDLIRNVCAVDMPIRTVGEYLRRWGYTAKRPGRHARRQDPAEVRAWLGTTYPGIEARARAEGAEILWCDEVGVGADEYPGTGYAREGQPVTIEVPDRHARMNMISAISNGGKLRFMTYAGTMTAVRFIGFLDRVLRSTTGKIFLIVDRLRAHTADEVGTWVANHADRLELFERPRYSPELNPGEDLNNDRKGRVNRAGLPDTPKGLRSHIQGFMTWLRSVPGHIISYFSHPEVQYAAAAV